MTPPDPGWMPWLDKIGWPLSLMIGGAVAVFWVVRALWSWGRPHLDRWIEAKVEAKDAEAARHASISEAMTKLVDKTIEIQESNSDWIKALTTSVPTVCRWKPSKKPPSDKKPPRK